MICEKRNATCTAWCYLQRGHTGEHMGTSGQRWPDAQCVPSRWDRFWAAVETALRGETPKD